MISRNGTRIGSVKPIFIHGSKTVPVTCGGAHCKRITSSSRNGKRKNLVKLVTSSGGSTCGPCIISIPGGGSRFQRTQVKHRVLTNGSATWNFPIQSVFCCYKNGVGVGWFDTNGINLTPCHLIN